jgi:tetratricopeptide (TPR) repeat protein/transcriptional regulator with XRE-family HTH domain
MSSELMAGGQLADEPPGRWLQRRRQAAGLTQEDLAERSGLSVRTVRNCERGAFRPHLRSLRLMAAALDVPQSVLGELCAADRESWSAGAGSRQWPAEWLEDGSLEGTAHSEGLGPAGSQEPVRPRQLPPSVAHFAGRAAELATLDHWLGCGSGGGARDAMVISAIGGMAGVGKTALALHWAHRVADEFPDGQLYVNLRGYDPDGQPAVAETVLPRFLDALGAAPDRIPSDLDGQMNLYRSLLAGRRMLIMADNARDAAQVRPLLPGSPGCLVLVTTRSPLTGLAAADGARVLNLEVLTPAEAAELLSARLGAGRVAAEPGAVADLIQWCGHLPLALAIAAARASASNWPLAHLAAELRDGQERLSALEAGDATADLRSVFSWSYRKLSPGAARMFRLLGIHPGPDISVAAAASLADLPTRGAQLMLGELAAVSLISEWAPGRYSLHDLVRAYSADLAQAEEAKEDFHAAVRRTRDHYLHTANAAARFLSSGTEIVPTQPSCLGVAPEVIPDSGHAMSWFEAEHQVALAVVAQATGQDCDDLARQLPWALTPFLDRAGLWHEAITCQNTALACAERLGDLTGQARTHLDLGCAHFHLGHARDAHAHFAAAAALSHRVNDQRGEASAWLGFSLACDSPGQLAESLSSSLRALALAKTTKDLMLQARASNNAGYLYALQGDLEQGMAHCQQALNLHREIGEPFPEAFTWDSLGYIHLGLGDHRQAADSYRRAIALFRQTAAPYLAAESLARLGDVHAAAGDLQQALETWRQALVILDSVDHPDASQIRGKLQQADKKISNW